MQSFLKNAIILIGLGALMFLGYYLFVIQGESTIDTNSNTPTKADLETQNFLRKLQQISALELSRDLFTDPKFDSFVKFTLPIESVPVGRDNPFTG